MKKLENTTPTPIMSQEEVDELDLIGYCSYCKDAVFADEDYVKDNGSVDHKECWKQKKNIVEELNFEEE